MLCISGNEGEYATCIQHISPLSDIAREKAIFAQYFSAGGRADQAYDIELVVRDQKRLKDWDWKTSGGNNPDKASVA